MTSTALTSLQPETQIYQAARVHRVELHVPRQHTFFQTELPSAPHRALQGLRTDTTQRRREQNRKAQRAYRDRKEKHVRTLMAEICEWRSKHDLVLRQMVQQSEEVRQMRTRMQYLAARLSILEDGYVTSEEDNAEDQS